MFTGWLIILVCSLLLYDALLYASLRTEIRSNVRASASVAAASLKSSLTMGVRFGKNLRTFRGIDRILETAGRAANRPLAVFDASGALLHTWKFFPPLSALPDFCPQHQEQLVEGAAGSALLMPVLDRNGSTAGFVGAWIDHAALENELHAMFKTQMLRQLGIAAAARCCLHSALRCGGGAPQRNPLPPAGLRTVPCRHALQRRPGRTGRQPALHPGLRSDAAHTRQILTERSTDCCSWVSASTRPPGLTPTWPALPPSTTTPSLWTSLIPDSGASPQACRTARRGRAAPGSSDLQPSGTLRRVCLLRRAPGTGWTLHVSLLRGPWMDKLVSAGLDILTLVAIALIFMVEMFLLLSRSLDARAHSRTADYAYRSSLFRPLMFVFVLAMDMSVSFIPLRMAELTAPGTLSRDVLLGLPISAEMGMTGLSVLVAGAWMKRRGARAPLMTGIACMALGYLGSMLAQAPWQFVAARAVVGLGYGLSLLTAQALHRQGRPPGRHVCGRLRGVAVRQRTRRHAGRTPGVRTGLSAFACILACLFLVPLRILRGDSAPDAAPEKGAEPARTADLPRHPPPAGRPRFLSFILLALLPSALLCVGFLNYFLPCFSRRRTWPSPTSGASTCSTA